MALSVHRSGHDWDIGERLKFNKFYLVIKTTWSGSSRIGFKYLTYEISWYQL